MLNLPDVGEVELLKRFLNQASPDDVVLRLYTNDRTPSDADTLGDYSEASGNGYAARTLAGASWNIQTIGGVTAATYAQQIFTLTSGPGSYYGYFVTNAAGTILLWAERFTGAPFNIPAGGGEIKINPRIEAD